MSNIIINEKDSKIKNTLTTLIITSGIFSDICKQKYNKKIIEDFFEIEDFEIRIGQVKLNNDIDLEVFLLLLSGNKRDVSIYLNDLTKLYTQKTAVTTAEKEVVSKSLKRLAKSSIDIKSKTSNYNSVFTMIDYSIDANSLKSNPLYHISLSKVGMHYLQNSSYLAYQRTEYMKNLTGGERILYSFSTLTKSFKYVDYKIIERQLLTFSENNSFNKSKKYREIKNALEKLKNDGIINFYEVDKNKNIVISKVGDPKDIRKANNLKKKNASEENKHHKNQMNQMENNCPVNNLTNSFNQADKREAIQKENEKREQEYNNNNISRANRRGK